MNFQSSLLQEKFHDVHKVLRESALLDLATLPDENHPSRHQIKKSITDSLKSIKNEDKEPVNQRLLDEFFSSGPLTSLIDDKDITEILINGSDSIWYEKNGEMIKHNDKFLSKLTFNNFVHRILNQSNAQVNLDIPYANSIWKHYRLHVIQPPLTSGETHISLRYQPENPWTLEKLQQSGWCSEEQKDLIKKIVQDKSSFLVIGSTGSGKTSVLNACLNEVGKNERIVTIEDTDEIKLPNDLSAKLLTRVDPMGVLKNFDQSSLVVQALRMRPERLILGEVRGAEAKDMMMAFATGHTGGMCTLHAQSARQALIRLEMLTQLGAPNWGLHAIRNLIFLSLQYIFVLQNENKKRTLEGVYKITSVEEFGLLLEKVI